MKNLSLVGDWWIPDNPEEKISGTLNFKPRKESRLKLYGHPEEFDGLESGAEIILGKTSENERVTLTDCQIVGKTHQQNPRTGDKTSTLSLQVSDIFLGENFEKKPILFDKITVRFPYLSEWVNKGGVDIDHSDDFSKTVIEENHYTRKVDLDWGEIEIDVGINPDESHKPVSSYYEAREDSWINIVPEDRVSFEDAYDLISKLRDFFSLMLGIEISPMSVIGEIDPEHCEDEYPIPERIEAYFRVRNEHRENDNFQFHWTPLFFESIEEDFPDLLENWLELREDLRAVMDFYFGVRYSDSIYPNNIFLNLVQALEGFHRARRKDEYMDEDEYKKKIRSDIYESIPSDIEEGIDNRLRGSINRAYKYSLKDRLEDIYKEYEELLSSVRIEKDFLKEVRNKRHYFSHLFNPDKEVNWNKIVESIPKLRIMLEICFFKEIGVGGNALEINLPQYWSNGMLF